jgi:hypothetical protein
MIHKTTPAVLQPPDKTFLVSEANFEFSYDSRIRAEVAQENGFYVFFLITVSLGRGQARRLFL